MDAPESISDVTAEGCLSDSLLLFCAAGGFEASSFPQPNIDSSSLPRATWTFGGRSTSSDGAMAASAPARAAQRHCSCVSSPMGAMFCGCLIVGTG